LRSAGKNRKRQTIGFYGVDTGVGTTHLAVAAACYAVRERGVPTALVELGSRPCIRFMDEGECAGDSFTCEGVDCYPQADSAQMPGLLNGSYSYLILDLGCEEDTWQEFLRCDLKYLVVSLSPWRMKQAEDFMVEHEQERRFHYFTAVLTGTGSVYEKKKFQHRYHVPVRSIPLMADPFRLVKDQLPFFQALF
jgi:serine/threonine-protein kinase